jgi:hypothetical protein
MVFTRSLATFFLMLTCACATAGSDGGPPTVADTLTTAKAADGRYISWREHVVDERNDAGQPLTGGDGLVMADLDRDGLEDIVSVHESDVEYDGVPDGFVRIAFATHHPDRWVNITLAQGAEAGSPEDAAVGDVNSDGYPDVVVAAELGHLIYFQNPGSEARAETWRRLIIPATLGRGSFIRVFLADLDGDGRLEVSTANKGAQNPTAATPAAPISVFSITGPPLDAGSWREAELGRYQIPQNAQPIDLDRDGDLDIVGGVRVGARLIVFRNDQPKMTAIEVRTDRVSTAGFNLAFSDLNDDGRLDIVGGTARGLAWFAQPAELDGIWASNEIGDLGPDRAIAISLADIDGDGDDDVLTGGYSDMPRDADGDLPETASMGRLAWFENRGPSAGSWARHDISRRRRGMFDAFIPRDLDGDGDIDFVGTRGNSQPFDGVIWLEQVRTTRPSPAFRRARTVDSAEHPLPPGRH